MRGFGLRVLSAAACVAVLATSGAVAARARHHRHSAAGGRPVTVVARGVPTPTEFAVTAGRVFVSGYGDEQNAKVAGGVYVLGGGKAVRVPGSPAHVFGLAAAKGTLYLSSGGQILAWSGWNGRRFQTARVVVTEPDGFGDFNGLAVGPDGLIYVGANPDTSNPAYANSFLTVEPASGAIAVVATGIRQPWQPLFLPGRPLPLVSDLNQDDLGPKRPPDYLLAIERGADYGYPECPATPSTCRTDRAVRPVFRPCLADGARLREGQALHRALRRRRHRLRGRDARGRRPADTVSDRVQGTGDRGRGDRRQALHRGPGGAIYRVTP